MKRDAPIIVPYDPGWPGLFVQEKKNLSSILTGIAVEIEHIGSTAVPGLGGEPVIDILLGVLELDLLQTRLSTLQDMGYQSMPEEKSQGLEHRFFWKETAGQCAYHLYAVEIRGESWRHYLLFRDYLKAHEKMIQQYYELKMQLAAQFKNDRSGYTDGKLAFIKRILSEAEQGLCPFC